MKQPRIRGTENKGQIQALFLTPEEVEVPGDQISFAERNRQLAIAQIIGQDPDQPDSRMVSMPTEDVLRRVQTIRFSKSGRRICDPLVRSGDGPIFHTHEDEWEPPSPPRVQ